MKNIEIWKFAATCFMALCAGILVPLALSANAKLDRMNAELGTHNHRLTKIETWMGEGRRYTQRDAEKDFGVMAQVLQREGLRLDDHELRIRKLESKP